MNTAPLYIRILQDYRNPARVLPLGGECGAVLGVDGGLPELACVMLQRDPWPSAAEAASELATRAAERGVLDMPWYVEESDGKPKSLIPVGATHRQIIAMIADGLLADRP